MNKEFLLNLRKIVVPEFVYGEGAINLVGQYAKSYSAGKILIVTDPGVINAGWVKIVEDCLNNEGIPYVIFHNLTPNPKDFEIMEGAKVYLKNNCDVILAIGGGSPMDCAKGIGLVSTNNKHILEFEGVDMVPIPGPPLICIPTTSGSSADVSQFAIITNTTEKTKIAIISKTVVPDVSLIDPDTLSTIPPDLAAATGIDALVHACESFVSNVSSRITDLVAIEAVRLINNSLVNMIKHPLEKEFRDNMMMASLLAGIAFSNASLGLVHGMAHSLGGLLGIAHGFCNAILFEHVIDFNYESAKNKYDKIAAALGIQENLIDKKSALIKKIAELRAESGIKGSLKDFGVRKSDIEKLAVNALKDPCLATNPRNPKLEDIKALYERAI